MAKADKPKKCRRCGEMKAKNMFVDISGAPNPRGRYCIDCHILRLREWEREAQKEKEAKLRRFKALYGESWKHYCLPRDFSGDLYAERENCPYCGNKLPPEYLGDHPTLGTFRGRAHIDHMDPLQLGGEDSIRNAVYVCDKCNYKKGKRSFIDWLKTLSPKQRELSRTIYEEKHGHPPEAFVPGPPTERCGGVSV